MGTYDAAAMDEQEAAAPPVKVGSRFRCDACSTEIIVVKAPAGPLSCCGRTMERMG